MLKYLVFHLGVFTKSDHSLQPTHIDFFTTFVALSPAFVTLSPASYPDPIFRSYATSIQKKKRSTETTTIFSTTDENSSLEKVCVRSVRGEAKKKYSAEHGCVTMKIR